MQDQINTLASAKVIAGMQGSGFHTLFAINTQNKKVIQLTSRGYGNSNYVNQSIVQGTETYFIEVLQPITTARNSLGEINRFKIDSNEWHSLLKILNN